MPLHPNEAAIDPKRFSRMGSENGTGRPSSMFAGWKIYPCNLSQAPSEVDAVRCHERLKQDAQRLFMLPDETPQVQIIDNHGYFAPSFFAEDSPHEVCRRTSPSTPEQLQSCLSQRQSDATRLVIIPQTYSWGQLQITEELFRKLLTGLQVHPGFLDVVHLFGEKITAVGESFSTCLTTFKASPLPRLPLAPLTVAASVSESSSESGSAPATAVTPGPEGGCEYEIAYNIKYVARHGRGMPLDPFSIRESGVYEKFRAGGPSSHCQTMSSDSRGSSTWILLNPPKRLGERACAHCCSSSSFCPSSEVSETASATARPAATPPATANTSNAQAQLAIDHLRRHARILTSLSEDWPDYINFLEASFTELADRCFLTSNTSPTITTSSSSSSSSSSSPHDQEQPNEKFRTKDRTSHKIITKSDDIRRLQLLTDKIKRLIHLLELNKQVYERLRAFGNNCVVGTSRLRISHAALPAEKSSDASYSYSQFENAMENCISRCCDIPILQLRSLVSRTEGIGAMISHILDVRTAETSHRMNAAMHDLTQQGAKENKLIRQLTRQSTRDTRSMRAIALVSAIFLPATFVATLFGSNFFGFEASESGHSDDQQGQQRGGEGGHVLKVASNVWIYVVVSLALSSMTVALWYCWCARSATRSRSRAAAAAAAGSEC